MAQDVLCNRNTPTEIRVRTMVAILHETRSWDMPAVIPSKEIRSNKKNGQAAFGLSRSDRTMS